MREARFTKYKEKGGEYLKTHKCYTHTPSHQSKQSDVLASLEQLKKKVCHQKYPQKNCLHKKDWRSSKTHARKKYFIANPQKLIDCKYLSALPFSFSIDTFVSHIVNKVIIMTN